MKIIKVYPYLSLAIIQALLILLAFPSLLLHGGHFMFSDWGDGFKNYFTLRSYVHNPIGADGLFKYDTFSYPFGDYVYYTDNTPFFSVLYRWICQHVTGLSADVIPVFNVFILCGFLWCSLLAYFIFSTFLGRNFLSFALAVFLPWINMQVPRLWEGDFNLSFVAPVLAEIALFIAWQQSTGNRRKQALLLASMSLLLLLSFLLHGYYIAILALLLGGMFFFLGASQFKTKAGKMALILSVIIPLAGLALVLCLLHSTDKYLALRPVTAMCYDCSVLKTNFSFLFTHYDFHSLAFPIATTRIVNMETMAYLGNIGLFSFAYICLGSVFSTSFRNSISGIQKDFFTDPLKRSIFMGGVLTLIVSFGERYTSNRDALMIYTPVTWLNEMGTGTLLLLSISLTFIICGVVLLLSSNARNRLRKIGNDYVRHPLKKVSLLFCIALLVFLLIGRYTVTVYNILNPFFYFHFITKEVEQFRSLSRFSWPFFWVFYIWVMYTMFQIYNQSGKKAKWVMIGTLVVLGVIETKDYVTALRQSANKPDLLQAAQMEKFGKLKIDFNHYQAILPFPYYNVGSEDVALTIDDDNEWSIYTMQLALYSRLPLMSCKMSRTPPEFSAALMAMVTNDSLRPLLRNQLNDKPILIAVDRTLVNDPSQGSICARGRPETLACYTKANEFVGRHHLVAIDSLENVVYYCWQPK